MDQLDRVLVLMSVNSGDTALSHKALYCVHHEKQEVGIAVAMHLNF